MMTIVESGMTFGPYAEEDCFRIEDSTIYQHLQQDVKIAEFLLLRTKADGSGFAIWVIEAKSSAPKPNNQIDFDKYIDDIREKLTNALTLGIAICLKRHSEVAEGELPTHFKILELASVNFKLVLVINGFEESWLPPLQEALSKNLCTLLRIWGRSAVAVMNDTMARQYKLIS
jgi:hypothetical protein